MKHEIAIVEAGNDHLRELERLPAAESLDSAKIQVAQEGYNVIDAGDGGQCETTDTWDHKNTLHVVTVTPGGRSKNGTITILQDRIKSIDPDRISSTSPERWLDNEKLAIKNPDNGKTVATGQYRKQCPWDPARAIVAVH